MENIEDNYPILKLKKTPNPAWVIKQLLSKDDCEYYRKEIDRMAKKSGKRFFQTITKIPRISQKIWTVVKDILPQSVTYNGINYRLSYISDHVTMSRHQGEHIGIHRDSDVDIVINGKECLI